MAALGTLPRWEQVRKEDHIVFGVPGVGSLITDGRGKRPVAPAPQILPGYRMLMDGKDFIERATNEPQREQVPNAALRKYLDLKFDG